jgi:hypothetical protein
LAAVSAGEWLFKGDHCRTSDEEPESSVGIARARMLAGSRP